MVHMVYNFNDPSELIQYPVTRYVREEWLEQLRYYFGHQFLSGLSVIR